MLKDINRYKHLIEAYQYHYNHFHFWMVFFIAILSGLFIAYYSKDLAGYPNQRFMILVVGYIVSVLFHFSSKCFCFRTANFADMIHDLEKQSIIKNNRIYSILYKDRVEKSKKNSSFLPLERTHFSVHRMICFLSFVFTYGWGMLILKFISHSILNLFFKKSLFDLLCLTEADPFQYLLGKTIEIILYIVTITIINFCFYLLAKKWMVMNIEDHDLI